MDPSTKTRELRANKVLEVLESFMTTDIINAKIDVSKVHLQPVDMFWVYFITAS